MPSIPNMAEAGEGQVPLLEAAEEQLTARRLDEALAAYDRARQAGEDPDRAGGGLWMTHMLRGEFEGAWLQSDALRARHAPDPHQLWRGEPIAGRRVVVRCLHGLGDAVQMLRYAPLLRRLAAEVWFEVPPRFVPVARCFAGVHQVFTWGENAPATPPGYDVQVEVMELPYLFRTTLADLPLATGYLSLPRTEVLQAARALGRRTRPRVGLVWSAGEWNLSRCIPPEDLGPLVAAHPGVEFWSLAHHRASDAAHVLPLRRQLEVTGDGMLALAATIANLDLVITVDTLAAHLAGALGKPACLLLQHAADWRWMYARTESPWYPSLQLFRQPVPGDWASAVRGVQQRLATL